jgi:hypothetical protein
MSSLWSLDLDPNADEDDECQVVEGVTIAPLAYFDGGPASRCHR